jgi:hypothetical protein
LLRAGLASSRGAAAGASAAVAGFTRGGFHGAQYIFQGRFVPQIRQAVAARGAVAKAGFATAAVTGLVARGVLRSRFPRAVAGTGCLLAAVTGELTLGELPKIAVTGAGLPR